MMPCLKLFSQLPVLALLLLLGRFLRMQRHPLVFSDEFGAAAFLKCRIAPSCTRMPRHSHALHIGGGAER
jgi:hypothetical protein